MEISEINKRYSGLAESECCLSCGGAVNYAKAKENEICIDLGSGRGTDVMRMAQEVGSKGFVYGIDVAEGMIEKATKTAQNMGFHNVKFINCTLEDILLPPNTADLLISNCTLNHAENKQKVWNEIYRLLKPGGRFVISDIYASQTVPDEFSSDPEKIAECWAGAVTKSIYMKQIENAGFAKVDILEESVPYKKGEIEVSSFTIAGVKPNKCCCCK